MKKHIYLHFSNFDQLRELSEDECFEGSHEYNSLDLPKLFKSEYGRLKTNQNFYHVLVGKLEQEGCPWCASPVEVVKLSNSKSLNFTAYCIQCVECYSRGPILNITDTIYENKEIFNEYMNLLWCRYKSRRAWDEGFINPYESININQSNQKKKL